MLAALIAGGVIDDYEFLSHRLQSFDLIIAVDGGLRHLVKINLQPDAIIGDFDSVSQEDISIFKNIHSERHPVDKDHSDTELALDYAFLKGADHVIIFGGLGARMDHSLSNLFLLSRHVDKVKIETECETLYAIYDFNKGKSRPGQRISLFPLGGKVVGVTTKGLKWNLADNELNAGFFSLSNCATGESFEVSISSPDVSGGLICIIENV